jgi:hypothetical protein
MLLDIFNSKWMLEDETKMQLTECFTAFMSEQTRDRGRYYNFIIVSCNVCSRAQSSAQLHT